ncbi:MAG: electron transfer flavoprotein subunit alpha/FixB family protein [Gracilibacteraceae bacterium]|jgi:electron transfer flavoprotein alpha subunit|nr:electron transfer flavoprotein subunit alpha/FixB family protein [Gracilibacteraceae bacterium]
MSEIWIYSETPVVAAQLLPCANNLAYDDTTISVFLTTTTDAETLINSGADSVRILIPTDGRPESCVPVLAEKIRAENPLAVLFGGTCRGKEVAARCAALLDAGLVSDALAIRKEAGCIETDRMVYGGLAVATEILTAPALIVVSPVLLASPEPDDTRLCSVTREDVAGDGTITVKETIAIARTGADLSKADKIVCVGRGVAKREDLEMVYKLAELIEAEVSCTRAVNEYQWFPPESYIGISGFKVNPTLYLSFGVSGQVQHLSGIRDSKIIVAVDSNEKAPVFTAADYGIVGDLYEVIPLLISALQD